MREHRPWTEEHLQKLRSMAGKYPSEQIAKELGRGLPALRVKAHKLKVSLSLKRGTDSPDQALTGPHA